MGLDISIKQVLREIPSVNQIYRSWKLYPNYHKSLMHILKDLLLIYYSCTIRTRQEVVELTNSSLLLQILDISDLHIMDRDYGLCA